MVTLDGAFAAANPSSIALDSLPAAKDFATFAVEDAHSDRVRRPHEICSSDDCRRHIRHPNIDFLQSYWFVIPRPSEKLNPERL
jgi:hypothetical protein